MSKNYKYLFGPVPSRRFGRSLGVDLNPRKTCDFDCVFCQLGPTRRTTMERKEYVPIDAVLDELRDWLESDGQADFVTLSGSGEPTLHSRFGAVFDFVRRNSNIPTLLLTNGSLLMLPEVRADACKADVVKISLSAWDQESFERINQPDSTLEFDEIVEGMKRFRSEFGGDLRMEVFLVPGINTDPQDVSRIASIANEIKPDMVQLNTAVRPTAQDIGALSRDEMEELAGIFGQKTEVIADFSRRPGGQTEATEAKIVALLRRRPCTAEHMEQVFGMHSNELSKYTGDLLSSGKICSERKSGQTYYFLREQDE